MFKVSLRREFVAASPVEGGLCSSSYEGQVVLVLVGD